MSRRWTAAAFALYLASAPPALAAKVDPAIACGALKLKTVGATASTVLGCHAHAAQKGLVTATACVQSAGTKLVAAFAKAEAAAAKAGKPCPSSGDAHRALEQIDAFVGEIATTLRPRPESSKCAAKKIAAVGKYTQKLLAAHGSNRVKADVAKFADKTGKAEASLVKLFDKLEGAAKDCQTAGDVSKMVAWSEALVVNQVCDDGNLCTDDGISGLVCSNDTISCPVEQACDFRTGACAPANCCLLSAGGSLCVVEIPGGQIPTSMSFCQSFDAGHTNLTLISFGSNCVGWRAAGAGDCP